MGKAYTEEEREQIRIRLFEAGLELFHDQGIRNISIRELTKRAGIAQGGFYNFFPDKDAFVMEIIHYRTKQKLELLEKSFDRSLADPAGFVSHAIFYMSWDLKKKAEQKQMYADILHMCLTEKKEQHEKLYLDVSVTLKKLLDFWERKKVKVSADVRGILNVIKGTLILYTNLNQLDEEYAEMLLKTFIEENCRKLIVCGQTAGEEQRDDQSI